MFKNITIKLRLIFVIVLLAMELIVGAAVGLFSLGHANDNMQSLYADRLVGLGRLDLIVRKLNLNQLNLAEALSAEPSKVARLLEEIETSKRDIDQQWNAYSGTARTAGEKEIAARFAEARAKFVGEALQPAIAAIRAGEMERARAIVQGPMVQLFQPVRSAINALIQVQLDEGEQTRKSSQSTYELVRVVCLAGMAFGLVLAAVVGAMLVRGIVNPLEKAVQIAGAVASGDLTQTISASSNDETGRMMHALRDMNEGLAKLVGRVRAGTDTIATASGQIAVGNLDLSSRTEQQAASLEETASSMEELTSTVQQNADNARQANALAQSASEVASKGGAVVSQVVQTMGEINTSASKMADIISVIDGIAFQTNILALNAAVEAARAGEQGRGFAVVANEVRNLAQRSATAAKEIKVLIDDSVNKVNHGSQLVDQAGATMGEIVQSVSRVTDIMAEIMAASQEQTAGIDQVNQAMVQMDQATQQNAALVEQASAATQSLREEAELLARTVDAFRLSEQHVALAAPTPAPAPRPVPTPKPAARLAVPHRPARPAAMAAAEEWEAF